MHLIIDAHQDLAWNMATFGRDYSKSAYETRQAEANTPIPEFNGDTMLGYPEFQNGKVAVVFGTLFASPARQEKHAWESQTYQDFNQADRLYRSQLDLYYRLGDTYPDKFKLIRTNSDLAEVINAWNRLDSDQKISINPPVGIVILMEGAEAIQNMDALHFWWEGGVRIIGPAWAGNRFCGGTRQPGPLTSEGVDLLDAMADFGFILDISHMDELASRNAIDIYPGQVIATHANASARIKDYQGNRHLSNDIIRHLIGRDGIMGMMPINRFLDQSWRSKGDRSTVSLQLLVDQMDYVCQLVGNANHIGIGSDFDGGFGLQSTPFELDTIADLQKLPIMLAAIGYSSEAVAGIMGQNWQHMLEYYLP